MDAIVGQEGEGPGTSGTPRQIGAIIIGSDPVAVDCVATGIAGLDYKKIPSIFLGFQRDFITVSSPEDISIIGQSIEDLHVKNFQPTKSSISSHILRGWLVGPTVKNLFIEKPWPVAEKCTLCYKCKSVCPAGAISKAQENRKIPGYDYRKCIRCFCCIEFCPEAAISLKKGLLMRLFRI
jgi:formate hydrogenlyase subunit 6/NADH:ubiquinone oxidoreductase subunit I